MRGASNSERQQAMRKRSPEIQRDASSGTSGGSGMLPHFEAIQSSFGSHDVSGVNAFSGGAASEAAANIGAEAYATGNNVVFGSAPDLHTAAHEAAHVVQQASGVSLYGGVGEEGDQYEKHADAVADRVVQGNSAQDLLDSFTGTSSSSAGGQGTSTGSVQMLVEDQTLWAQASPNTVPPPESSCKQQNFSELEIRTEIATYAPAPSGLNGISILDAFLFNDPVIPDMVQFGPDEPMTVDVRGDQGVAAAREDYYSKGQQRDCYGFGPIDFTREVGSGSWTTHMIGSYTINIAPTADGQSLLIAVYNSTSLESFTRNPLTGNAACQNDEAADCDLPDMLPPASSIEAWREAMRGLEADDNPDAYRTISQVYWWTEPLRAAPSGSN